MNYSMQNFMIYIQNTMEQDEINKSMCNVLEAYCIKMSSIGYTQVT